MEPARSSRRTPDDLWVETPKTKSDIAKPSRPGAWFSSGQALRYPGPGKNLGEVRPTRGWQRMILADIERGGGRRSESNFVLVSALRERSGQHQQRDV